MKDKCSSEADHKVTKKTDFNALFSGMNLSAGARSDFAVYRKLVEPTEPLIDIENTTASTLLENSDFSTTPHTNESNSEQNPTENDKQTNGKASNLLSSKHTNSEVHANQFTSTSSSETQNSNNFDLMSLETSDTSILDFSTPLQNSNLSSLESNELKSNLNVHDIGQEPDKRTLRQEGMLLFNPRETTARPGVSGTNNVDLLNWKQSNSTSSSSRTNSTQNIELLNTEPQNPNPPKSLPQKASHINPNRTVQCIPQNQNSDLLSFQPEPRSQTLPGGLVLATNSSSASPRRPFPKDMKSETDGFDFIRKSTKADAFSFINDEIQASKTKQK
ncbi:Hypothetical predicted protein [Paramuricea clavata]|uniref:Uncharacterized protein n=2 Tax=Paramuricea clavata TaxID=317549 RepID=A0A6S7JS94_PARCT|nr:Hypothetical predicted protein [Paramuricea clavata]